MKVRVFMNFVLCSMTNSLFKGQASDRLTSSDMELDALTAKQIYAEVRVQTRTVTMQSNLVTKAANPGSQP